MSLQQLNPLNQDHWLDIYKESAYTLNTLCDVAKIDRSSVVKYLECSRAPKEKNCQKMEEAMSLLVKEKKLTFHPSYGYATAEQIKDLKKFGFGPNRDAIMRQIAKQTKNKGKLH